MTYAPGKAAYELHESFMRNPFPLEWAQLSPKFKAHWAEIARLCVEEAGCAKAAPEVNPDDHDCVLGRP